MVGLLKAWGVPAGMRSAIPVVADRCGIVAIAAGVFGFRDWVREQAPDPAPSEPSILVLSWCERVPADAGAARPEGEEL